jgi:hypothetical protein
MLTLTIRHGHHDDLKELRRGVADAWRRMIRGEPWRRFVRAIEGQGYVRALELTHGWQGWHPHLHVVIVGKPGWNATRIGGRIVSSWLKRRWMACVARAEGLGRGHVPSWAHAARLTAVRGRDYLLKFGCELVLDHGKRARNRNRNPWQIALDWTRFGRKADARAWRHYCASMRGAKFLTWSRYLRTWAGVDPRQKSDLEVAKDPGQKLGQMSASSWRVLQHAHTDRGGRLVLVAALEIGECKGPAAALRFAERYARPRIAVARRKERGGHAHTKNEEPCAVRAVRQTNTAMASTDDDPLRGLSMDAETPRSVSGDHGSTIAGHSLRDLAIALTAAAFRQAERSTVPVLRHCHGLPGPAEV